MPNTDVPVTGLPHLARPPDRDIFVGVFCYLVFLFLGGLRGWALLLSDE
jgi:hypothetical protein